VSEFDREGPVWRKAPLVEAPPFIHALYSEVVGMLAVNRNAEARDAIATLYAWVLNNYPTFHPGPPSDIAA